MEINVYLDNAILYGLAYRIDVKTGQAFTLVMSEVNGEEVYAKNDKILEIDQQGTDINIEAKTVGESKIRIMKDTTIVRELLINVVDVISRPATNLNVTAGEPISK